MQIEIKFETVHLNGNLNLWSILLFKKSNKTKKNQKKISFSFSRENRI